MAGRGGRERWTDGEEKNCRRLREEKGEMMSNYYPARELKERWFLMR